MTNPQDPYGVPAGSVPRASVSGYQRTEPLPAGEFNPRPCPDCGVPHGAFHKADCPRRGRNPVTGERMTADEVLARDPVAKLLRGAAIDKAVDDWLLMERKARAWDELRGLLFPSEARVLAEMDRLVHSAHGPSTR